MTHTQPSKPTKPIWKRWWMIIVYVVIGLGVIGRIFGMTGQEAEPTRTSSPRPAAAASTSAPTPVAAACEPLPDADLTLINSGATGAVKATSGQVAQLPDDVAMSQYKRLAIVILDGAGTPGWFVMGAEPGDGPLAAGDFDTQAHFTWGAATETGSTFDRWRMQVIHSDTADTLRNCLG